MVPRRALLVGAASALAATAGCVGSGDSDDDGGTDERSDPEREPTATETPSYHFRAAPVEGDDLEPVLSTDDGAVAELQSLLEVIAEVTESFEVVYRSISADDAAAFEALTADVERYFTGNPPGYYFEHEGRRVSVALGGG